MPAAEDVQQEQVSQLQESRETLASITQSLNELGARADQLRRKLAAARDDVQREDLNAQLTRLEAQRRALRATFQRIALGGLDLTPFEEQASQKDFNWQNELLSILRPLFFELRNLTERPRAVERLRTEQALIGQRLLIAEQALEKIDAISAEGLGRAAAARVRELKQQWSDRHAELTQQRAAVDLQLDTLQKQDVSVYQQIQRNLRDFLVGRGLTLAVAVLTSALVAVSLLSALGRWVSYRNRRGRPLVSIRGRILVLTYRLFSGVMAALVFLMVLYAFGDTVLLALSLIVVVALLLSVRTHLPRYIGEARLVLNAGQVRERERVIYQGIPWDVRTIGIFAKLNNPELENGILRLPLKELETLISRPLYKDEPWFPCRPGEYVLLSDETLGLVERQTPEIVQLLVRNARVLYATTDFMAARPRNLSRNGFTVTATFGIGYQHRMIATTDVPTVLHEALVRAFADSPLAPHVENVQVEFQAAAASSLDYLVLVTVDGAAAEHYFRIGRMVQAACVDACNARGWVIPVGQLTIHRGDGFEKPAGPRLEAVATGDAAVPA